MKEYHTGQIRNIALVSHNGAGKTTFVERLLFNTGATTRMGNVQNGNAVLDFEEEEIARHSSVSLAIAPIEWQGIKFNLLDTPGYADFAGEVNSALRVTEGAIVFVEAVAGVEVGTELVWKYTADQGMPRVLLINKMDRDNVRVERVLQSVRQGLSEKVIPAQLPIGEGPSFKGVVDLLTMRAYIGNEEKDIPKELVAAVNDARLALMEIAAEGDDDLTLKYLEGEELTNEEIVQGLKEMMVAGNIVPIFYAASFTDVAIKPFMNALGKLMPAPNEQPFTATNAAGQTVELPVKDDSPLTVFVFKSREDAYGKMSYLRLFGGTLEADSRIWHFKTNSEVRISSLSLLRGKESIPVPRLHSGDIGVVVKLGEVATNETLGVKSNLLTIPPVLQPNPISSVAIHPISQSDVAKLNQSLNRLVGEDPTFRWHTESATHETILEGMGAVHLEIAVKKLHSKFGVNVTTSVPKIPYRETITKSNSAEYTHKKQTGGAGQYARVFLRVESLGDDEAFVFASEIFGGSISQPFVAAVEKGCRQALDSGPMAGFPVVGIKAIVYDGKEHPVDSKEIAFQVAGREGFKKAALGAGPVLLEPIYELEITVPADNMGDIMGDLNSRRARVMGMDSSGNKSVVRAEAPLAEVQNYAADLRSMTQGRGIFATKFLRYGRVPTNLQQTIVDAHKKEAVEQE